MYMITIIDNKYYYIFWNENMIYYDRSAVMKNVFLDVEINKLHTIDKRHLVNIYV